MSHLITFNCTKVRPQSDSFIGLHSSLIFCTFCTCAKGQFSIKTQFCDLVHFISIYFVSAAGCHCFDFHVYQIWSQLVHPVKLRTRNTIFFRVFNFVIAFEKKSRSYLKVRLRMLARATNNKETSSRKYR